MLVAASSTFAVLLLVASILAPKVRAARLQTAAERALARRVGAHPALRADVLAHRLTMRAGGLPRAADLQDLIDRVAGHLREGDPGDRLVRLALRQDSRLGSARYIQKITDLVFHEPAAA